MATRSARSRRTTKKDIDAINSLVTGFSMGALLDLRGTVQAGKLFCLLSEFLALKRGSISLYEHALNRSRDPEIREKFRHLGKQALRQTEDLEAVIRDLGGNPLAPSESAKQQEALIERLMLADDHSPVTKWAEWLDMEIIALHEYKCMLNWELLSRTTAYLEDPQAQSLIKTLTSNYQARQALDLDWAKRTLARLKLQELLQPVEQCQAA
jgi:hypothetical protein